MASSQVPVVTFTKPLVLEFEGNMYKNAITLGDVDNDGLNELIVGNDKGDLAIFKGKNSKPVRFASELGLITCVTVGDLVNLGRNVLLVVTSCGRCYVYDFLKDPLDEKDVKKPLKHIHFQKLPANIKIALIGDINGDSCCEMVVALTDRIVRTYKWVNSGNLNDDFPEGKLIGQNKWELSDQIGGIALNRADNMHTLLVSQPGGSCFTLNPPADTETGKMEEKVCLNKLSIEFESLDSASCNNPKIPTEICGDIELDEEHSFDQFKADSSAACSSNSCFDSDYKTKVDGNAYVLATVNGVVILVRDRKIIWKSVLDHPLISISQLLIPDKNSRRSECLAYRRDDKDATPENSDDESLLSHRREHMASFFPFSGLKGSAKKSSPIVLSNPSTPSKMTIPIPNSKPKRLSNTLKYGRQMITKIIACSTDGTTFILNARDGSYCKYNFHDSVCCYTSGFYGCDSTQKPCIAYVSYTNEIFMYHDVTRTLEYKPKLMDLLKSNINYVEAVRKLGIDIEDREKIRQLNSYLLDGYDCKMMIPINKKR